MLDLHDLSQALMIAEHEVLLFVAVFFAIGCLDELAIDILYIWFRLTGRIKTRLASDTDFGHDTLAGQAAVFIPAWQEAAVIGATIKHMLGAWPQAQMRIYVGCYRNDPATMASVLVAARGDPRVRLVIVGHEGPTSKADCLNRLYRALGDDEARDGEPVRMVVLHDAEDMVDPAGLALLDLGLWQADFVQLPVLALPQPQSRFVGTHYTDEFAEAHARTLVVRDALGAAIPGAGVGCAIARTVLARLGPEPFARQSLTEDYELGLNIVRLGGRGRFLRCRASDGRLIATRAYFPTELSTAVRQKTRWMHGIALQSWDRLGWTGGAVDLWMQLRDRRGPFAAILLVLGYGLALVSVISLALGDAKILAHVESSPLLQALLALNTLGLLARLIARTAFSTREHGLGVGLMAMPRLIVSNVITIMAGRRALAAYVRTLRGEQVVWDKTDHSLHPATRTGAGRTPG